MGRNPSIADPVEWAALKAAKKRGARIIVIDPKRTQAAQMADLWLAPRVGTDAALALAMTDVLISEGLYDQALRRRAGATASMRWPSGRAQYPPRSPKRITGVPADQIVAAARMYADGPSTFVSGHGIDAFSAGVQTFRAYHCLVAISGNVDRPGGNLRLRTPKGFRNYADLLHMPEFRLDAAIEQRTIGADRFPLWAGPKGWQTACHNPSVIDAMLTGKPYPVRALYASGVNILVTYPDTRRTMEALRSLDFVAVAAHAMTPTAEYADIVLPKTTTLEEEEVSFMPSGPTVLFTRAVVPPQGEARSEIDIAAAAACQDGRAPGGHPAPAAVALAARVQHLSAGRLAASASRTWSAPATTRSAPQLPASARSRHRPARSSSSRRRSPTSASIRCPVTIRRAARGWMQRPTAFR